MRESGTLNTDDLPTDNLLPLPRTNPKELWTDVGVTFISLPALRGDGESVLEDEDSQNLGWYQRCTITPTGEDVKVRVIVFPRINNDLYRLSDNAMSNLVRESFITLDAIYDLVRMLLIVTSIILIFFIFVFVWKTFAYFVSRIRSRDIRGG
jgi:hypothetical protein